MVPFMPPDDRPTTPCLIAFGSNQGDSAAILEQVRQRLDQCPGMELTAVSTPRQTAPVGGPDDQVDYLNAALLLNSSRTAEEVHERLIEIENQLGRVRKKRWDRRRVDLDLLLFGRQLSIRPDLLIPHPRMTFRRFVLEPAAEIAPGMLHPVCGRTIQQLLESINGPDPRVHWVLDDDVDRAKLVEQYETRFPGWQFQWLTPPELASVGDRPPRLTILQTVIERKFLAGPYLDIVGMGDGDAAVEVAAALQSIDSGA